MSNQTDPTVGGWPDDADGPRFTDPHQAMQARMQTALTAPDPTAPVANGPWAGFTRGTPRAWCEMLYGNINTDSQVAHQRRVAG